MHIPNQGSLFGQRDQAASTGNRMKKRYEMKFPMMAGFVNSHTYNAKVLAATPRFRWHHYNLVIHVNLTNVWFYIFLNAQF